MRVVVDTNVFFASFFGGPPRNIVDLWKTGEITLCLTRQIMDEYVRVLLEAGCGRDTEIHDLLGLFRIGHHAVFSARTKAIQVCRDSDDDKFIEAAVALEASVIVSGDKHLLEIEEYAGIEILRPREFLNRFFPQALE